MTDTQPSLPPAKPRYKKWSFAGFLGMPCLVWVPRTIDSIQECSAAQRFVVSETLSAIIPLCLSIGLMLWAFIPHRKDTLPQNRPQVDAAGRPVPRYYARVLLAFAGQVIVLVAGLVCIYRLGLSS